MCLFNLVKSRSLLVAAAMNNLNTGKYAVCVCNTKSEKKIMIHLQNLEKNFILFLIMVFFSFSTTLGIFVLICIFYNLRYCHFDSINIVVMNIMANLIIN